MNSIINSYNIQTKKRGKIDIFSLEQVVDICDNADLLHSFQLLSKRLRYGLNNQCAISLYEMGFNDRVIAIQLADIIESDYKIGNKKDIKKIVKQNTEIQQGILSYLEHDRAEK